MQCSLADSPLLEVCYQGQLSKNRVLAVCLCKEQVSSSGCLVKWCAAWPAGVLSNKHLFPAGLQRQVAVACLACLECCMKQLRCLKSCTSGQGTCCY